MKHGIAPDALELIKGIARPSGRARIETPWRKAGGRSPNASPGRQAGRGLKRRVCLWCKKQNARIARPSGRARIETVRMPCGFAPVRGIARPSGRARIETRPAECMAPTTQASPGRQAGRGLKHAEVQQRNGRLKASPGRQAGRGLKRGEFADATPNQRIARPSGRARIETAKWRRSSELRMKHRPAWTIPQHQGFSLRRSRQ